MRDFEISQLVQNQYEQAPFPPVSAFPVSARVGPSWLYSFIEVYYHAFGKLRSCEGARLLDAGCGTGVGVQQIRHLAPGAEVHACDLSRASLDIARQRIEALDEGPVSFHHLNLLDLSALPGEFDAIFCSGVVHHTADPVAALRQLKSKLKPDGVLYLMLYSQFGRRPTMLMRRALQLLGGEVEQGLSDGRELFAALPREHPLAQWEYGVKGGHNLEHREWFIDSYLNAQEKNYSINEVFADLGRSGLRFVRFAHPQWWELGNRLRVSPEMLRRFENLPELQRYELMENLFSDQEQYYFLATHAQGTAPPAVRDPRRLTAVRSRFARAHSEVLWQGYYGLGVPLEPGMQQLIESCQGQASLAALAAAWIAEHPAYTLDEVVQVLFELERLGVLFLQDLP